MGLERRKAFRNVVQEYQRASFWCPHGATPTFRASMPLMGNGYA